MANLFALILTILTIITGIAWCVERMQLAAARRRLAQLSFQKCSNITELSADNNVTKKVFNWSGFIKTWASLFPALLLVFIVRSFLFEPFQIPSGSMIPTLLVGDFILVEKFAYGLKNPITYNTLLATNHPQRGDIVVFKYPDNPNLSYIKRVVGLPGDRVFYNPENKSITVQPACTSLKGPSSLLSVTYGEDTPSDFVKTLKVASNIKTSTGSLQVPFDRKASSNIRLIQRKESMGSEVHNIINMPGYHDQLSRYYRQPGSELGEWLVPHEKYFMMGDNRDNSFDSRYWGFVPEKNLVGKAVAIWMSFDKQEGRWPTGVRLSRIGSVH